MKTLKSKTKATKHYVDEYLKPFIGGAKTPEEQLKELFKNLKSDGARYKKRADAADKETGEIMAKVVQLETSLQKAGLKKRAEAELRKRLPKHKSDEGHRRADKRQTFCTLALEAIYGTKRSRLSRWKRVINRFKRDGVEPEDFGKVLKEKGGIEEYLETKQNKATDGEASSTEVVVKFASAVQAALEDHKDGDHACTFGFTKVGNKISVKMMNRDGLVRNAFISLAEAGALTKTFGVDPKKLNLIRVKLKSPFETSLDKPVKLKSTETSADKRELH